jgi:UDP-N-acetylglucosamine--N-acetylmuramyl-(pentapeptide) pyrophosphoryl-undecaprenol N-acetylglucosamine transferase
MRRSLLNTPRSFAREIFEIPKRAKVLLVFGGGSGSVAINHAVRSNLKTLTKKYFVLHVCGKGNVIHTNLKNYSQKEFITDMGAAYACADGIIARAGSGTVFEILALKKPALFIPLEGQTRGDQKENAEYFRRKGLCHVLPQSRLNELADGVEALFSDKALQENLSSRSVPFGNDCILNEIERALNL